MAATSPMRFGFTGATRTPCSAWLHSAPKVSAQGTPSKSKASWREGSENVVGPMPPYGEIIMTENAIWTIIAWIRAKNCEQDLRDA